MVIREGETRIRHYQLTLRTLQAALGVGVVVLLLPILLAAAYGATQQPAQDAAQLAQANELLVQEVTDIRKEMRRLEASVISLSAKDERYRVLANLDPLDDEVKLAGVGGPGTRTLQTSKLWQLDQDLAALTYGTSAELEALTRRANLLASSWNEASSALETQNDLWERTPSILPVKGHISSRFTYRRMHPILNVHRPHLGIDISARRGTPVMAAAKGTVRFAGDTRGDYGWMVDIDHGNGVVTRYAHLERGSIRVRRGQTVDRWDKIAEVGTTGLTTSPHVHYEVIVGGRARNPEHYVIGDVLRF